MRNWVIRLWILVAVIELALAAWLYAGGFDAEELTRLGARYTARISFAFFLVVFIAQPLATVTGAFRGLATKTRALGLAFALAHIVHFGWLTSHHLVLGELPYSAAIYGGGAAYVFVIAMALTSTNAARRALGALWKILHTTGLYYIWVIFTVAYYGRVAEQPEFLMAVGAALAAMALRLVAIPVKLLRRRASQAS